MNFNSRFYSRRFHTLLAMVCASLLTVGFIGCQGSSGPVVSEAGKKFVLSEKPEGAVPIVDARANIADTTEIVLITKVGVEDRKVFEEGKASFLVREAFPDPNAGDGHDADNCPFCKRRKSPYDGLAMVHFKDSDDKVIDTDARKLLGLKEDQEVIIKGSGSMDESGALVVSATGIYFPSK